MNFRSWPISIADDNETMFRNMAHAHAHAQARAVIRAWADGFNETRPHSMLGDQTPKAFADHLTTATRNLRCAI